ncbi:MAG: small multi-drug export protein [Myxococcota bacterium]|jgi:uncharacterized membrane protein|nr:small multi-drug export protein [Myxococcota bacterium]
MAESVFEFFRGIFGAEAAVFIISMLPIIELRGAIPVAAALKLPMLEAYGIAVAGNMLPVPFILLFIRYILDWMRTVPSFSGFVGFLDRKIEKNLKKYPNLTFWGLAIFVAVPLPGTGAWTGALLASFIEMKFAKAMLANLLGVLIAGIIVTAIAYGLVSFLGVVG